MTSIEMASGRQRFAALLTGRGKAAYDKPLLETEEWIVAPTLGAIVPGWLLIIPRRPAISCREWSTQLNLAPLAAVGAVAAHLGLRMDEIIWFEHGPATSGTPVGCGLDYAHMHIIVRPQFDFEAFVESARAGADLSWSDVSASDAYAKVGTRSYYVAGSGDTAIVATDVEAAGSQFLRRVTASLIGDREAWNYRHHPHIENVEDTIDMFRRLEGARRRGG